VKPKAALSSSTEAPDPSGAPIALVDLKAQYARLKPDLDARIAAVLNHGQFIMGHEVGQLEAALAARSGVRHCVAVGSGTDALLVALMAERIGPGDGVVVPAFTFPATAEVVMLLGATPIFVDVDPATFNIDPADAARRIEAARADGDIAPKAMIAVDLFGLPADYPKLSALCEEHGLFLLADAAQSFGAKLNGTPVGGLAPATAISFFPSKPLGCYGDGGGLLTDDDDRAALYRSIRAHGKGSDKYAIDRVGLNSRLDTLQAAIVLAKLEVFDDELARRSEIADAYDAVLAPDSTLKTPHRVQHAQSAWAQYTFKTEKRDAVSRALREAGIGNAIYYPAPLHRQPAYSGTATGSLPVSEALCQQVLSLPMHPYLTGEEIGRVGRAIAGGAEQHG